MLSQATSADGALSAARFADWLATAGARIAINRANRTPKRRIEEVVFFIFNLLDRAAAVLALALSISIRLVRKTPRPVVNGHNVESRDSKRGSSLLPIYIDTKTNVCLAS